MTTHRLANVLERLGRAVAPSLPHPRALEPATLAALRLPDGAALPADLRALLAYDAFGLGLLDPVTGQLAVRPLRAVLEAWAAPARGDDEPPASGSEGWDAADMVAAWISVLPPDALPDAPVIEVTFQPGSQEHLLVLQGERIRVLGCEKRFEFWWKYESLAAMLADWAFGET